MKQLRVGVLVAALSGMMSHGLLANAADTAKNESIHEALQKNVADGSIVGGIAIASRKGVVEVATAAGVSDARTRMALAPDSVLWIASMSKPITATAVMMLVEQGKIRVEDPVSRYIPEFSKPATVRVLKTGSSPPTPGGPTPEYDIVPAQRPITVKDLLTHTSGLQSIGVPNPAVPEVLPEDTLASWVPKLANVPLDFQPGSSWAYSNAVGFDVLARIVEITSGMPFDQFLRERIFKPLGMKAIGFQGHMQDYAGRIAPVADQFAKDQKVLGINFFSGAAGLFASLDEYRKFAEMLANDGTAGKARLLKASSVQRMRSNQVGNLFHRFNNQPDIQGMGFGYAVAIVENSKLAGIAVPDQSYGWDGAGGTRFWVSPKERSVEVFWVPKPAVRSEVEALLQNK